MYRKQCDVLLRYNIDGAAGSLNFLPMTGLLTASATFPTSMLTEVVQRWSPYHYKPNPSWPALPDPLEQQFGTLDAWVGRLGMLEGDYFLIGPNGQIDMYVNLYLRSSKMRGRSEHTRRKYTHSLALFLNFLLRRQPPRPWYDVDCDDIDDFKFWRMEDKRNPRRVAGSTWNSDLAALYAFYKWIAKRYIVHNPIALRESRPYHHHYSSVPDTQWSDASDEELAATEASRDRNVKWLTPVAVRHWADWGVRGIGPDGREMEVWRGRNDERDGAIVDLLYGTGLRLQEGGSLLVDELPPFDPDRRFYTCRLANACGKRRRGRKFWMPRTVREELDQYIGPEGERWRAIDRAQRAHRYDNLPSVDIVEHVNGRQLRIRHRDTDVISNVSLDALGPRDRRQLFRCTPRGIEPLALWLNEDGLPRDHHGWEKTFQIANQRIQRLAKDNTGKGNSDLDNFVCSPHKLRHSFAFKWYMTGRLLWERSLGYLTEEELHDFRVQFGNVWDLVRALLGHTNLMTTMHVYLEPFQTLDVERLLGMAESLNPATLDIVFRTHPMILTDPLGAL